MGRRQGARGLLGDGAVEAKPNEDANNNGEDFADISPRLDYKVKFAKAGKYRVWVRGYGKTDSDNSCHIGLDGKAVETSDRIGDFPTEEWAWYNDTHDTEPAVIEIKEPGTRTLNLFMREDGFVADKILLTRDEKYFPRRRVRRNPGSRATRQATAGSFYKMCLWPMPMA